MRNAIKEDLLTTYGGKADEQIGRYEDAVSLFKQRYGAGKVLIFRAPGRVNLIGGHTDYNHGYVMPVALTSDIVLLARARDDGMVHLSNISSDYPTFQFSIAEEIAPAPSGEWGNYARGVAQRLARTIEGPFKGLDGLIVAQSPQGLPQGLGLSSSSALTVVVALALAKINKWDPSPTTMMEFCSQAEWYVGTRGGIMDHFICLLAKKDHALFLDCRPKAKGQYHYQFHPFPKDVALLVVNIGQKHKNTSNNYNQRVAACRAGVQFLRQHYPTITHLRDVEAIPWATLSPLLPEEITLAELQAQAIDLGDIPALRANSSLKVRARCHHVWHENQRVLAAVEALRTDEPNLLGQLMSKSHDSARDEYENSGPLIEQARATLNQLPGVMGSRLTGAGWGGCLVAMVKKKAIKEVRHQIDQLKSLNPGLFFDLYDSQAGQGAGLVCEV